MIKRNVGLWILLLVFSAVELAHSQNADSHDFSNKGLAAARKESLQIIQDNQPPDPRVLASETYFLDAFNKKRKVDGKPFTMAGTFRKLIVCNVIAKAMLKTVEDHGSESAASLRSEWAKVEDAMLEALAKEDPETEESVFIDPEAEVWKQFLKEWQDDVASADADRFKDALLQAAYEITKAGLEIQTGQEAAAKSEKASPSGTAGGSSGSRTSGSGNHPFHERQLNHIYRKHDRKMNKVTRIRARGGR